MPVPKPAISSAPRHQLFKRRVLHPDGEVDGQEDYLDRSEQFRIIEATARRLGFLFDHLEPLVEGGREHDLIFDDATGTVLKFTKPSSAAYVVEFLEGKPHPRLTRDRLKNWEHGIPRSKDAHRKRQQAQDPEALAARFGRKSKKRTEQIAAILDTLRALGLIG